MKTTNWNREQPCYVMEEDLLRRNLALIRSVADATGVEIIVAFKAFALWKTFPIFREYSFASTASSLWEAQLGFEELGQRAHAFSPAYQNREFAQWKKYCSHITYNSLSQYSSLGTPSQNNISYGLRINPKYSPVETDLYNPAMPGSRFGISAQELGLHLPKGIEGLHCHVLCEGNSFQLEKLLSIIERDFASPLREAKWLNLGGGHLMTHKEYNVDHLIAVLKAFRQRYPHLKVILEPGSAFAWQTGFLRSHVVDIVEHDGIKTAILDVSFTCHMPDCLEMPYQPTVRGANSTPVAGQPTYRLGGNSCLSGDYIGDWSFEQPLKVGDEIIFEDMIHYTTVKTNMFNGIAHPALVLLRSNGEEELLRAFDYEDYKQRMD